MAYSHPRLADLAASCPCATAIVMCYGQSSNALGCDLFIREAWNVCTLTGVLDCDAADIAALIEIQNSVLVQIL